MYQPHNYGYNSEYSSPYPSYYTYSQQGNGRPPFPSSLPRFNSFIPQGYADHPRITWGYNVNYPRPFIYYNQQPQVTDDEVLNLEKKDKIENNEKINATNNQTGDELGKQIEDGEKSEIACKSSVSVSNVKEEVSPDRENQCRRKRIRTAFTVKQMKKLEDTFERVQYMVGEERKELAASLGLSDVQVKVWFQNRRIKWRKLMIEKKFVDKSPI
uniref:Homeobox domain-containing protein n=1 Tax=Strigamia maritima TaxID=126957 RepID=T1J169_STRMM